VSCLRHLRGDRSEVPSIHHSALGRNTGPSHVLGCVDFYCPLLLQKHSSVHRRPLGCHPSPPPLCYSNPVMLRNTLRQCSRQLQCAPARATFSSLAQPSRNAISTCRRPLALTQRRQYAISSEDTNKGVVRASSPAFKLFDPIANNDGIGPQRLVPPGQHGQLHRCHVHAVEA
jgi:hypothetical protein